MNLRRTFTGLVAALCGGVLAGTLAVVPAHAAPTLGERSLAAVLTADGNGTFDSNWNDYDIVTQAVLAVVAAKPSSNVALLTDGSVALTAFIPNDRAFRDLAHRVTGKWQPTEEKVFTALVKKLGVDAIESVLLYHVVPGATILAKDALKADGAKLSTALPNAAITVDVRGWVIPRIVLVDRDRNSPNALVNPWQTDINAGNKQVAHGITRVLRPLDLRG